MIMRRVKFGLIGAGLWGEAHAYVYSSHHQSELVAVCDLREERAKEIAKKYGASHVYTDYNQMLHEADIEAVGVVTPDFAHRAPVVAALEAGKHVLVEKPLATSIEDADAMVRASQKTGARLMVDFHNRWSPPFAHLKETVEQGGLGKLVSAYFRLNDKISVATNMLSWASRSSILWFLGSHTIDTIQWLFSDDIKRVYSVSRRGVLDKLGVNVPDIYQSILEFNKGYIATIENNWIVPNGQPCVNDIKFNLLGDAGMVNMDLSNNQLYERILPTTNDNPDILVSNWVHGRGKGFAYESIRHFVECIAEDKPFLVSVSDAYRVTEVILALMESAEKGLPVELGPRRV